MTPLEAIEAGRPILADVLTPYGFAFVSKASGESSGGTFASAAFTADVRSIEFSFRKSLGLVTYRWGTEQLAHDDLMRTLRVDNPAYPGFGRDALAGFRDLAADLRQPQLRFFLEGTDEKEFNELIQRAREFRSRLP